LPQPAKETAKKPKVTYEWNKEINRNIYLNRESKGQYVASRSHTLLTAVYWQNSSNVIYSYQVRCMHVAVMAPGQRLYG
jgi:hypothetical protein